MKKLNYYSQLSYWKKYHSFLPPELQYDLNKMPTEEYWRWNDMNIHLDRMKNPTSPVKVIILHGAGGNGRIVGLFGNFLYQQGFEYLAPDLIGYGLSQNLKNETIEYKTWVSCVSDLVDLELSKDNRPVILFGLSVGGMLAYQVAAVNKNVKKIIATTLADSRSKAVRDELSRNLFLSRIGFPFIKAFQKLTDSTKIPIRWLCKMDKITNDPAFSSIFSNDKLAGGSKVELRFIRTYMNYDPELEPENFNDCSVLYLHPEKDTWTTLKVSKPFYDRLRCPKRFLTLKNCGHAPYEEPGLTDMKFEILKFISS